MNRIQFAPLLAGFAGFTTLCFSASSSAQEACGDVTCGLGFECQTEVGPCPSICHKTDDGDVLCDDAECVEEEYFYCTPAACQSDADCGDAMVCHTFEDTECTRSESVLCDEDGECDIVGEDVTCETVERQQCTYRHELPCESDAQCGEGFNCIETEMCWCESSSGGATDEPDSARDSGNPNEPESNTKDEVPAERETDEPANCGCEPSGEKYCQAQSVECEANADCPSGWTCEAGGETCWGTEDGVVGCETLPSTCYPPRTGGGSGTGSDGEETGGPISDATDEEEEWSEDDGEEEPNAGTGGDAQWNIWSLLGCSVKHPVNHTPNGLPWLAGLLGVALVRRRKAR